MNSTVNLRRSGRAGLGAAAQRATAEARGPGAASRGTGCRRTPRSRPGRPDAEDSEHRTAGTMEEPLAVGGAGHTDEGGRDPSSGRRTEPSPSRRWSNKMFVQETQTRTQPPSRAPHRRLQTEGGQEAPDAADLPPRPLLQKQQEHSQGHSSLSLRLSKLK